MSLRCWKKSAPPVAESTRRWRSVVMASNVSRLVPRMRQRSSSFLRSAKVCSGLLGENRFTGYEEASVSGPFGWRLMKFGVKGNTRYGLVPVLSLFEMPRAALLCTTSELMLSCHRFPSFWSMLARRLCLSYPVFFAIPPSRFTSPEKK